MGIEISPAGGRSTDRGSGDESGVQGPVRPVAAGDPAPPDEWREVGRRAGREFRSDQAIGVAPLRGLEGGGPDPQPPRGAADFLLAQHDGRAGRAGPHLGPVRRRRAPEWRIAMTRSYALLALGLVAATLIASA